MSGKVGRSGSPMPRLITSMPAFRFSATRRSSSANMYAGTASRRREGSVSGRLVRSGVVAMGRKTTGLGESRQVLREITRELAAVHAGRRARELDIQVLGDLHRELTAVETHRDRARRAAQERGHGRAAGPGARRES